MKTRRSLQNAHALMNRPSAAHPLLFIKPRRAALFPSSGANARNNMLNARPQEGRKGREGREERTIVSRRLDDTIRD